MLKEIKNFNQLNQEYDIILQKIEYFTKNTNNGKIPKNTINIFIKQISKYLDLIEKQKKKIQKEISKSQKYKDKSIKSILKITLKKLEIMESNFQTINNKYKNLEVFDDRIDIKIDFKSMQEIIKYKEVLQKVEELTIEYKKLNNKNISLKLDDKYEKKIEKEKSFIFKEFEFLQNAVNILFKINKNLDFVNKIKNLNNGIFLYIYNLWDFSFPQEKFSLKNCDITKSKFYDYYKEFLNYYENYFLFFDNINKKINKIILLNKIGNDKFTQSIFNKSEKIINSGDIESISTKISKYYKKNKIDYLIKVYKFIEKNSLDKFNKLLKKDIYNQDLFGKGKEYYKQYQNLLNFVIVKFFGDKNTKLFDMIDQKSYDYNNSIKNIIKDLKKNSSQLQEFDYQKDKLTKEKKIISNRFQQVFELSNKYKSLKEKYYKIQKKTLYSNSFQKEYISDFIEKKTNQILQTQIFDSTFNDLTISGDIPKSIRNIENYINSQEDILNDLITEKNNLDNKIKQIKDSLKNIEAYNYKNGPYTLSKAKKSLIKLSGDGLGIVLNALENKLEKKYNKTYKNYKKSYSSSSWSSGSSSRSSSSSWSSSSGSFGGSYSSSGGTSW